LWRLLSSAGSRNPKVMVVPNIRKMYNTDWGWTID
jgi:hypothetical protein